MDCWQLPERKKYTFNPLRIIRIPHNSYFRRSQISNSRNSATMKCHPEKSSTVRRCCKRLSALAATISTHRPGANRTLPVENWTANYWCWLAPIYRLPRRPPPYNFEIHLSIACVRSHSARCCDWFRPLMPTAVALRSCSASTVHSVAFWLRSWPPNSSNCRQSCWYRDLISVWMAVDWKMDQPHFRPYLPIFAFVSWTQIPENQLNEVAVASVLAADMTSGRFSTRDGCTRWAQSSWHSGDSSYLRRMDSATCSSIGSLARCKFPRIRRTFAAFRFSVSPSRAETLPNWAWRQNCEKSNEIGFANFINFSSINWRNRFTYRNGCIISDANVEYSASLCDRRGFGGALAYNGWRSLESSFGFRNGLLFWFAWGYFWLRVHRSDSSARAARDVFIGVDWAIICRVWTSLKFCMSVAARITRIHLRM